MSDNHRAPERREGLCATCVHRREIVSAKGSRFVFCELSKTDPRFPKYPPLPVLSCAGYRPAEPALETLNPEL